MRPRPVPSSAGFVAFLGGIIFGHRSTRERVHLSFAIERFGGAAIAKLAIDELAIGFKPPHGHDAGVEDQRGLMAVDEY